MLDKNNNTGIENSGNRNSGDGNSGDWNSGHGNSGDWNSGDWNSGNGNSGDWNSGDWNSGHGNSGDRNSGHWNSGLFNTDEPFLRMFNKETKLHWADITLPEYMYFDLTVWVNLDDMTDEEKEEYPFCKTVRGYLKTLDYKEAWKLAWSKASKEEKEATKKLPNFDAKIFEEITSIRVDDDELDLTGEEVEVTIKGKKYTAKILNKE